jgi:ATPase
LKSNKNDEKPLQNKLRVVPDTSIIIEGFLSRKIESKDIAVSEVIIHESVIAELESQANKSRETGFLGLEEVKRLRELSEKASFVISFKGNRPTDFEIKHAKSGEIDSKIRDLAFEEKATLITADKVQALVAQSKGVSTILYEFEDEEINFALDKYFDSSTMSVHIREGCSVVAKKGRPGNWTYHEIPESKLDADQVKELAKKIIEDAAASGSGFIEHDRRGSTIIQHKNNRVVIARPPFSDGYEITAVRPVASLSINDYDLNEKMLSRLDTAAEGVLIAGSPGSGKSTFAQSLAVHYFSKKKVVKTIESPRDLNVPEEISQYSLHQGSASEVQDILLLTRPDYVVFDEMRTTEDFRLFSDLRLSGIGLVGVMHATRPIDAVQRFIGRIDLGVIPHIIDTVLFVANGRIEKAYSLSLEVKVPSGMTESDLARPIVSVYDFETGKLEFEIYKYSDETVVMPPSVEIKNPVERLAEVQIAKELMQHVSKVEVNVISGKRCKAVVPKGEKRLLVGENGSNIAAIEDSLGIRIDVIEEEEKSLGKRSGRNNSLRYRASVDKKNVLLDLGDSNSNKDVDIYIDGEFLISVKSSKRGIVSLSLGNAIGKMLNGSLTSGRNIEVKSE